MLLHETQTCNFHAQKFYRVDLNIFSNFPTLNVYYFLFTFLVLISDTVLHFNYFAFNEFLAVVN